MTAGTASDMSPTSIHRPMPRRPSRLLRAVLFPFLVAHAIFPAMWVVNVLLNRPVTGDWYLVKVVANHFVAGDWSRLYAVGDQTLVSGLYWLYPPYALYVVAPLAWVPDIWAYWVLVGVDVVAVAVSLRLLRRLEPFRDMRDEWLLAIVMSAPMLTTIVAGQRSALIMLCIAGAASLWTRGKVTSACAVLGLLAMKPNWGIAFGLLAIVQRKWRGVATMAGVVVLLCALTIPLGVQLWVDFLGISVGEALTISGYEPQKQITLRAFLEGAIGKGDLTLILWAMAAVALIVAAVVAWRAPGTPLRHLGIAVLLTVSASPYLFFYDALVLAIPATVWWAERERWARTPWLIVGALLALTWCSEQWLYSWSWFASAAGIFWRPPVSIVGLTAAVWLLLAAREAVRSPSNRRPAADSVMSQFGTRSVQ